MLTAATKTINLREHRKSRVRDLILYLLISLTVVAAVIGYAESGLNWNAFMKWGVLALFTAFLLYQLIKMGRPLWREKAFWALTAAFLSIHLLGFALLLNRVENFKPVWFALIIFAEFRAFSLGLRWMIEHKAKLR
jgi:tellurite resistance protein TehA-like permease